MTFAEQYGGNNTMASIWTQVKVGMLIAMVYTVYALIQSVKTFKSIGIANTKSQSEI